MALKCPTCGASVDPKNPAAQKLSMMCSFCGKTQKEVRKLVAGPGVMICDECVTLCHDIITENPT